MNKGPQTYGYVIVGLTEGEKDFERFKKHYNTSKGELFAGTDFYITGVEDEIKNITEEMVINYKMIYLTQ